MKFRNDEHVARTTEPQTVTSTGAETMGDSERLAYEPPCITRKAAVRRVTLFSGSSGGGFTGGG